MHATVSWSISFSYGIPLHRSLLCILLSSNNKQSLEGCRLVLQISTCVTANDWDSTIWQITFTYVLFLCYTRI